MLQVHQKHEGTYTHTKKVHQKNYELHKRVMLLEMQSYNFCKLIESITAGMLI